MPEFIPGLQLSELFYHEAVKPIMEADFGGLEYSAALIGFGSEVLGFDTPQSSDHNWGPRLLLFLHAADYPQYASRIDEALSQKLPYEFRGYPTNFYEPEDEPGTKLLQATTSGPVKHYVWITGVEAFLAKYLGLNHPPELTVEDWLTIPAQKLRTITAGGVFHDGLSELAQIRQKLAYYPHDVWLLLLCAQWTRLEQEKAFMGRCGDVGDELGSQIIAARLVRDIMRLCFLLERQYAPYNKWFGTAFSRLHCAPALDPILQAAIYSRGWQEREKFLAQAYAIVAQMHNTLNLTKPLETRVAKYHNRPYLVLHAETIIKEMLVAITDPNVRKVLTSDSTGVIGSLDQWIDSTDILSNGRLCNNLKYFYE